MWGRGMVHGLGGLGLPFGYGRLPPPRAVDGGVGDGSLEPDVTVHSEKWRFPLKAGLTSGGLALVGDTAAQFHYRYESRRSNMKFSSRKSIVTDGNFWQHDFVRSLRMASYGFLLYGPLSDWWYKLLDRMMPVKNLANFSAKVVLNQVVLGPIVISIVFGWNSLWLGRLNDLPDMYRQRAFPALVDGWKFWTPMSFLNFGVVPLEARVAFMSTCAICWNFYLSSVVSKKN
ncbi:unnamed protein product [Calypogeia fissa]